MPDSARREEKSYEPFEMNAPEQVSSPDDAPVMMSGGERSSNRALGGEGSPEVVELAAHESGGSGPEVREFGGPTTPQAYSHGKKYASRVRARGVEEPSSHTFPYGFDDEILTTTPIPKKNGYSIYQKRGIVTGKVVTDPKTGVRTQTYYEGVYEIGVTKEGVIGHRFFHPERRL